VASPAWAELLERRYACAKSDARGCASALALRRVMQGDFPNPDFAQVFVDADVVSGVPGALFVEEAVRAFRDLRVVLVVRPVHEWWASATCGGRGAPRKAQALDAPSSDPLASGLVAAYGGAWASPYVLKRKYQEYVDRVARVVAPDRLLVVDAAAPDALARLCAFAAAAGLPCSRRSSSAAAQSIVSSTRAAAGGSELC